MACGPSIATEVDGYDCKCVCGAWVLLVGFGLGWAHDGIRRPSFITEPRSTHRRSNYVGNEEDFRVCARIE
jgi:hypothetical protein